jgi:hypothetical protein
MTRAVWGSAGASRRLIMAVLSVKALGLAPVPVALKGVGWQPHRPGPGTSEYRVPVDRCAVDVQLGEPHERMFRLVAIR